MANISLNHISLNARHGTPTGPANRWAIGQTLTARAETDSDARGAVTLRVGAQRLQGISPLPVRAGEALTLKVKTLGNAPSLQILTAASDLGRAAAHQLRRTLPQEGMLKPLLEGLTQLRSAGQLPSHIAARLEAIRQGLPAPGGLRAPGALRQALELSGAGFEPRLAAVAAARGLPRPAVAAVAGTDFKGQLLHLRAEIDLALAAYRPAVGSAATGSLAAVVELYRRGRATPAQLAGALRAHLSPAQLHYLSGMLAAPRTGLSPLPAGAGALPDAAGAALEAVRRAREPGRNARALLRWLHSLSALHELAARVDSALNRIVTTQLAPLAADTADHAVWLFDLPLRQRDEDEMVHLRFERRGAAGRDDAGSWSVRLEFDLAGLGRVQADVALRNGGITTRFTTERSDTGADIRDHLPALANALAAAGLSVERLEVGEGPLDSHGAVGPGTPLLDERA